MKLFREARTLKGKALCSLRRAVTAFNGFDEDGRVTCILLHMQHASEMLLKAILVQKRVKVFDPGKQTSLGFAKCVNLAMQHAGLTAEEAGLLRAVDAFRDAEQHWLIVVPEDVLYLHARGLVTIFDDLLRRTLGDTLASHLPARVLPISTQPPIGFDLLVDREYSQIRELLQPGRRQRDEARGRIRTLLAMESHVAEDVDVSEADIDRVEKAIRGGKAWSAVFPRLGSLDTQISGSGAAVVVRFTKKEGEGAPVRFIAADDPAEAAAVREVDLQRRFHLPAKRLAALLKLTPPRSFALRQHLGIDKDKDCMHVFAFGSSKHPRFSDTALNRMREALAAAKAGANATSVPGASSVKAA
ncbi:hypothetical protein [Roseomonas sp. BN140053]|uniref:hypothetical protein n=1 Tax=Roseomonas sp. BN140053 TaxID=3391898 RepID=UPI0039E77106